MRAVWVFIAISLTADGCISTTIRDGEFQSVELVDWVDRTELQGTKFARPLLKVDFTSRLNLAKYIHGWYNLGASAHFCNQPYVKGARLPAAWPDVYFEGAPVWGDESDALLQRANGTDEIFAYYVFIDVAQPARPADRPPQAAYDLRESPQDVCIRMAGGNEAGLGFRSNEIVVPKEAIASALRSSH